MEVLHESRDSGTFYKIFDNLTLLLYFFEGTVVNTWYLATPWWKWFFLGFDEILKKTGSHLHNLVLLPLFSEEIQIWCSKLRKLLDLMCLLRVYVWRVKNFSIFQDILGWNMKQPWRRAVGCHPRWPPLKAH